MIILEQVSKRFKTKTAVRNLNLHIRQGEVVGLIGENGAGKTTTLRMMATVMQPTTGKITIGGLPHDRKAREIKRKVGILFGGQTGLYDRLTARENIEYFATLYQLPAQETEQTIRNLADIFDMEDYLDERVGSFSTGMRQKVAIARSIVHNPSVILFDEPTSGLDIIAANEMRKLLEHFREEDKTVIFSSHIMSEVKKLCERVIILHAGTLRYDGLLQELYDRYGHEDLDRIFMQEVGVDLHA